MRIITAGLLSSVLVLVSAILSTGGAQASCAPAGATPGAGHWFDGWYADAFGTINGVRAKIENYQPYVTPGTVGTTAWVMLTRPNANLWAQVGYLEQASGLRNTFLQVHRASGSYTTRTTDPAQPIGSIPYYTVLYSAVPGYFTFEVAGAAFPWSGYIATADFVPTEGQIYGELQDRRNQMPGSQSNDVSMFQANMLVGGVWSAFNGFAQSWDSVSWPYDGPYSGVDLYIWDQRCVS